MSEIGLGRRIGLGAVGYAIALGAATAAVRWNQRGMDAATASSGMAAFGDAVLFFAVAALLSIAPTVYLLAIVPPTSAIWRIGSALGLALAATAPIEDLLWIAVHGGGGFLGRLSMLAPIRFFAAPVCLLIMVTGAMRSAGAVRRRFVLAAAIELSAAVLTAAALAIPLIRTR